MKGTITIWQYSCSESSAEVEVNFHRPNTYHMYHPAPASRRRLANVLNSHTAGGYLREGCIYLWYRIGEEGKS